jgi:hypothetical protein
MNVYKHRYFSLRERGWNLYNPPIVKIAEPTRTEVIMMPRKSLGPALAALLLLGASFAPAHPVEAAAPKIESDALEYNFGTVDELTPVEHVFMLKNIGDASLEIQKVDVS